jgi:plastocyanin
LCVKSVALIRRNTMRRILFVTFMVMLAVSMIGYGTAWAGVTVQVTREANKPDPVEVKVGEEVAFVNATGGGHAHVSFEGNDAVQFNVGHGGSQVRFDKPGTYRYTVHLSGVKAPSHGHSGCEVTGARSV